MSPDPEPRQHGKMPPWARGLGVAGLLPQLLLSAIILVGPPSFQAAAAALALGYAALILSFIGGAWWGLASRSNDTRPMLWIAAVLPSLIAFAALCSVALTASPTAGLVLISVALFGTLIVDRMLVAREIGPVGWLRLRIPLSLGLGSLTLLMAFLG